jgi:hypothetical protein
VCVFGRGNGGFGIYGEAGVRALWKDVVCLMESSCFSHVGRGLSSRAGKDLRYKLRSGQRRSDKKKAKDPLHGSPHPMIEAWIRLRL